MVFERKLSVGTSEEFSSLRSKPELGVVAHMYNPSTFGSKQGWCKLEGSLFYTVNSRLTWAVMRNLVLYVQVQGNSNLVRSLSTPECPDWDSEILLPIEIS